MEAYNNNILFKPFESDYASSGGIIIPDSFKEESNKGEIVLVGDGTPENPMRLKIGMVGYRVKDWGMPVIDNGVTYYLMEDSAIIALE